jgi:hypothetical protein
VTSVLINNKPMSEWTVEELLVLLGDEQWRESAAIDYKCEFRPRDEGFKKDVCAFANAQGGYLFFGIGEDDGVPVEIAGIENVGLDKFNLAISNALSASIEPSRPAYESHVIPLGDNLCVLIVHVFEGVSKPYRVRSEGRFWIRGNAGNEFMSYKTIEDLFLRTSVQKDKLQQLIDGRMAYLQRESAPAALKYGARPMFAAHFIPISVVSGHEKRYPLRDLFSRVHEVFPPEGEAFRKLFDCPNAQINMDGLMKLGGSPRSARHIQLFWNGMVELATDMLFRQAGQPLCFDPAILVPLVTEMLGATAEHYVRLHVDEPVYAVLSIENAAGWHAVCTGWDIAAEVDRSRLRTYPVRIDDRSAQAVLSAAREILDEFGYLIGESDFGRFLDSEE